ncbi:trigger factor [Fluviispira multicolorata]|uniref:Trigger factor n=1 Tax=Fluviispira multicolorata TaxID=2654512 RepID=A0A833N4M0_9BACT|nr:trigger factor [Fluviispira multicolorata]KAB8032166.1 trigger factor [Fluviispira multicolorata]
MTFSSTIEEVNSTRRKFKISVPASSIKDAFQAVATEIQKTAEIRGFRKGKAPATLIRKFYMGDIVKKAADRVINEAYSSASKTVDFQIVSHPHIEPVNQFDESQDFEFSATVDINPKIEIKDYQQIIIKMNKNLEIDVEAEVEKLLNNYARALGKTEKDESGRVIVKGDVANVSYTVTHDGKLLEGKEAKNQLIELNGSNLAAIEDAIVGMKALETKEFPVDLPENFADADLKGKTVQFSLVLNSVETLVPSAFDEEFAKRLGYPGMDEVRNNLRETIKRSNEEARSNVAFEQVVEQVLTTNEFEVAESLIESTIDRAIADANSRLAKDAQIKPENEEARTKYRDWANKQVRGILALGHIARQEGVSVTDDEMLRDMASYAMANQMDPQQLVKRAGAQVYDEFRGQVMIRKVISKILETAKVEYTAENTDTK